MSSALGGTSPAFRRTTPTASPRRVVATAAVVVVAAARPANGLPVVEARLAAAGRVLVAVAVEGLVRLGAANLAAGRPTADALLAVAARVASRRARLAGALVPGVDTDEPAPPMGDDGTYRAGRLNRRALAGQRAPNPARALDGRPLRVARTAPSFRRVLLVPVAAVAIVEVEAPATARTLAAKVPPTAASPRRAAKAGACRAVLVGTAYQAVRQAIVRAAAILIPSLQADEEGKTSKPAPPRARVAGVDVLPTAASGAPVPASAAGPASTLAT